MGSGFPCVLGGLCKSTAPCRTPSTHALRLAGATHTFEGLPGRIPCPGGHPLVKPWPRSPRRHWRGKPSPPRLTGRRSSRSPSCPTRDQTSGRASREVRVEMDREQSRALAFSPRAEAAPSDGSCGAVTSEWSGGSSSCRRRYTLLTQLRPQEQTAPT